MECCAGILMTFCETVTSIDVENVNKLHNEDKGLGCAYSGRSSRLRTDVLFLHRWTETYDEYRRVG